jgi:hypothetical protein
MHARQTWRHWLADVLSSDYTRGGRRADVRSGGLARPMHASKAGRNRQGAALNTSRRMNARCDRARSADPTQMGGRDAAGSYAPGLRAVAMMEPNCRAEDRAAPAPIATRIIAGAVRAVLLPALARLHGLHRRSMCERGESPAADAADARRGPVRDGEARQNHRQTGENAQIQMRHQGLSWKERSARVGADRRRFNARQPFLCRSRNAFPQPALSS